MLAKTSFTKFVPKKAELFYIKLFKKIKINPEYKKKFQPA